MSFFSWMRGARQRSSEPAGPVQRQSAVTIPLKEVKPKPTYVVMEPSDIADLVIYLNSEYARANELCAEADVTIKRQQRELAFLRERNTHLESSNRKFQASNKALNTTIATRNSSVNQKSAQLSQSQHMLKLEQEKGKTLRVEILESQMAVRRAECGDLYDDGDSTSDAVSVLIQHADLRPTPFVVVLVDGDSYQFLDQSKASGSPGPEIAQNLHREVSKYILSHPKIPPHSKIIARIFCNRSSMQGKLVKALRVMPGFPPPPRAEADRRPSMVVEKMVQFAETYPLFDYLDCGGGKERVDDKIRENTHLYLADSNCHSVFLAVCNDNGYMRILERYNNNPIPAAKIVLLTNGGITPEMAKLSFPKVQLDAVFMNKYSRKIKQGTSSNMGPVLKSSQFQGFETTSDYDLDYTDPLVRDDMDKKLNQMRFEKHQKTTKHTVFARLPYEPDEWYEERMRKLTSSSRPNLGYRRGSSQFVGYIGLRKMRPSGVLPTAPILPFLLHSEVVQSTHIQGLRSTESSWMADEILGHVDWLLD